VTDRDLDELRRLGEELRIVFTDERRAITTLDHEKLTFVAEQKRLLITRLGELRAGVDEPNAEVRALFEAVRVEARATALLASTATELVQKLLGRETSGYDRRAAKTTTNSPLRIYTRY
jgi:hypothetical protein